MPAGVAEIARWVGADPWRMRVLHAVSRFGLPDCWVGAGFVRNLVWDRLHAFDAATPLNDIDVLYFDRSDQSRTTEKTLEARLRRAMPGLPWSVRNQARMHRRNNDAPYRSTAHALTFWAETPTAVAVALSGAGVAIIAPLGIGDLIGLMVRPTPRFRHKMTIYRRRMAAKDWPALWPRLRVLDVPARPGDARAEAVSLGRRSIAASISPATCFRWPGTSRSSSPSKCPSSPSPASSN